MENETLLPGLEAPADLEEGTEALDPKKVKDMAKDLKDKMLKVDQI